MSEYFVSEKPEFQAAVARLLDGMRKAGTEWHTLEIFHDNEMIARIAPEPYSCADKQELYSLSKTFTSLAIGIAVREGYLTLDTKVLDLFPDKAPAYVSENLKQMTVYHLLTMNTGHADCCQPVLARAEDPARAFLEQPVLFRPGTHFVYNTGATCMLGIILKKLTALDVMDYLAVKFFPLVGIENVWWNQTTGGATEAGTGLHASTDDIAKLGLLYANGGKIGDVRVISEEWAKATGTPHSNIMNDGKPATHENGYGYQVWMKKDDGFSGEGAYGQYCIVFPTAKIVIAMLTESGGFDPIPSVYEFVDHILDKATAPVPVPNPLVFPPLPASEQQEFAYNGNYYRADPNPMGITQFSLTVRNGVASFRYSDGKRLYTVLAGNGTWLRSAWGGEQVVPKLSCMLNDFYETMTGAGCYQIQGEEVLLSFRMISIPHTQTYRLIYQANGNTCRVVATTSCGGGLTVAQSEIRGGFLGKVMPPEEKRQLTQNDLVNLRK